jgi:phosphatidate cytidylyltransferase
VSDRFWVRTATVAAGLGLFFVLVVLLPHPHHLALNVLISAASILGALELQGLLRKRGLPCYRFAPFLAGLLPAVTYLEVAGLSSFTWSVLAGLGPVCVVLLRSLWFRRRQDLVSALPAAGSSLLVLLYPALFLSFLVRLSGLAQPSLALLFFFSLCFVNDTVAYLFGTFLGARTRLNYAVSPNKSVIGFLGGLIGSVAMALLFRALLPKLLHVSYGLAALFGGGIGILTIAGDLVESALKRSAGSKDSGSMVPGRGGVLDSVDSWLLSAPAFYFVFRMVSG